MNQLEALKQISIVVADTGDFESIRLFSPRDATTNPSLILKAVQLDAYKHLLSKAVAQTQGSTLSDTLDALLVSFGLEILRVVPGRVSTETDARLSFNVQGTIDKARKLISLYERAGIERDRVLIKIASTFEGIQAAAQLEKESIRCNLTLLFSTVQAAACAEGKIQLISPFVGRIYDWHKKNTGLEYTSEHDPGVQSVLAIHHYYQTFGYKTEVMGASFRNIGQIQALAGCDLLTISPELLAQLEQRNEKINRILPRMDLSSPLKLDTSEQSFRFLLNDDAMATEKLAEGIRLFVKDTLALEAIVTAFSKSR